jgi:hypothetical protein
MGGWVVDLLRSIQHEHLVPIFSLNVLDEERILIRINLPNPTTKVI